MNRDEKVLIALHAVQALVCIIMVVIFIIGATYEMYNG